MKKRILKLINNRITLFAFAFVIMAVYLFPMKDVYGGSGDAQETWKVVTTFFSASPYHSYVMYKGLMAFLPNIVFYQLSLFFKLDQFFFVKIFNCAGFAYITTIGLPYFFSYIFKKKIEIYKIFIMTVILFFGIRVNFSFISVDFPSIMIMLLVVNSVIRIKIREKKLPIIYYLYMGVVFSMCMLFSGQYSPVVVCALLFLLFAIFIPMLKKKEIRLRIIAVLACFAVGYSVVKSADNYFVQTRVAPVRAAGEWLPTGTQWLKYALVSSMMSTKYPTGIPDNIGTAILKSEKADLASIEAGSSPYSFKHYIKIVLKYPLDFLVRWLERLFLGLSVDKDSLSFIYLLISYTLLFLSLLTLKRKCIKVKDVINPRCLLILALLLPSLVPCLMHVEMRCFMSVEILVAGTALLSDTLWNSLVGFKNFIIQRTVNRKLSNVTSGEIKISQAFVAYVAFVLVCFTLFATLYSLMGSDASILFTL